MELEECNPQECRLFIDSFVRSLKCILLHNGIKYTSITIRHSTTMKKQDNFIKLFLEKLVFFITYKTWSYEAICQGIE